MLPTVCFVTAHPNPANHFAEYVQAYEKQGVHCRVIAGKEVSGKFSQGKAEVVSIDLASVKNEELLGKITSGIASQSVVITDIANERWTALHQELSKKHPAIQRAVYYDNPERFVPGGYSRLAAQVMDQAQIILFANASLVTKGIESEEGLSIDLSQKRAVGIGYYPKPDAAKILELKKNPLEVNAIKSSLLERNGMEDSGQKVLVYTGGANEVYFEEAFPHFMKLVSELAKSSDSPLKNTLLVLQQHPRAKDLGDFDAKLVEELLATAELPQGFNFLLSDLPTDKALAIADGVFYYQTSMAAQFVFAGIPTVAQVGHETYMDLVVRAGVPSVTDSEQFSQVLSSEASGVSIPLLEQELGIDPNWKENLLEVTR